MWASQVLYKRKLYHYTKLALAGVAQLVGASSHGLIPVQGKFLVRAHT